MLCHFWQQLKYLNLVALQHMNTTSPCNPGSSDGVVWNVPTAGNWTALFLLSRWLFALWERLTVLVRKQGFAWLVYIQVPQKSRIMSHTLSLKPAGTSNYTHITSAGKSGLTIATQSKAHTNWAMYEKAPHETWANPRELSHHACFHQSRCFPCGSPNQTQSCGTSPMQRSTHAGGTPHTEPPAA